MDSHGKEPGLYRKKGRIGGSIDVNDALLKDKNLQSNNAFVPMNPQLHQKSSNNNNIYLYNS